MERAALRAIPAWRAPGPLGARQPICLLALRASQLDPPTARRPCVCAEGAPAGHAPSSRGAARSARRDTCPGMERAAPCLPGSRTRLACEPALGPGGTDGSR